MSFEFVNFKAVKEAVSIEAVLNLYNVQLRKVNRSYLRGKCPLPTHTSKSSEDSFGVHTEKNAWACQSVSCVKSRSGKKGGNVLDFVAVMENCSIRDAALKLQQRFGLTSGAVHEQKQNLHSDQKLVSKMEMRQGSDTTDSLPKFNRPLEFALKGIDASHQYLRTRGINDATATTFGVGFFPGKGSMVRRVVIPIHNSEGKLVAYAGRSIDDSEPKYKLPAGFHKSVEVFNLHRTRGSDTLIIVEGFFDCMKVHQAGYFGVVALMGSTLSREQEERLRKVSKLILMFDGDQPGREATAAIAVRLMQHTFVKVINLEEGTQPDQMSPDDLQAILRNI